MCFLPFFFFSAATPARKRKETQEHSLTLSFHFFLLKKTLPRTGPLCPGLHRARRRRSRGRGELRRERDDDDALMFALASFALGDGAPPLLPRQGSPARCHGRGSVPHAVPHDDDILAAPRGGGRRRGRRKCRCGDLRGRQLLEERGSGGSGGSGGGQKVLCRARRAGRPGPRSHRGRGREAGRGCGRRGRRRGASEARSCDEQVISFLLFALPIFFFSSF